MSDLTGVNLSTVSTITSASATKGATTAGGTGMMFIDDIGYGRTAGQ